MILNETKDFERGRCIFYKSPVISSVKNTEENVEDIETVGNPVVRS
jgi:hypothetical protein